MAKLSDIKAKNWTLSVDAQGEIVEGLNEISQCIFIIIKTQIGSDPLRPSFGCEIFKYIDRPVNEAIPKMITSIVSSLNIWETRIDVTKVTYAINLGATEFTIEWKEKTTDQTGSTKVLINGTN